MIAFPTFIPIYDSASTLPSPLSPRSCNLPPSKLFHVETMSDSKRLITPPSPPMTPPSNTAQRSRTLRSSGSRQPATGAPRPRPSANPLMRTQDQSTKERREGFLNRVQQHREENRWNIRGDQILQLDYITQQRAWEAQQAEAAPPVDPDFYDEIQLERNPQKNQSSSSSQEPSQAKSFQPQSQLSQHMDFYNSPHAQFSQQSQHQYQYYYRGQRDSTGSDNIPVASHNLSEIDDILAAEERELEALVALHEGEAPHIYQTEDVQDTQSHDEMWSGLPEIRHGQYSHVLDSRENAASSPAWSSDDAEFEAELLRLGVDAMDVSGG